MKKYVRTAADPYETRIKFDDNGEYHLSGLSNNALAFIGDILGQLSDGYWENSPRMENYWPYADIKGNELVIRSYDSYYDRRDRYCGFANMSEQHIKQWFADKIKQLAKEESGVWSRTDKTELDWLHGTVSDAYQAYDELKGRSGHKYE